MTHTAQDITKFVRAMRKHLQNDHGVAVPHSALRASYLKALGLNAHAQLTAAKESSKPAPEVKPSVLSQRKLYLAYDEVGVTELLALDAEGSYLLPADCWFAPGSELTELYATVPSVKRYGLPDYLANPTTFFKRFELPLSAGYRASHTDLGDDSGDSAQVTVSMPDAQWTELLRQVLANSYASLAEDVAEWCGLHYGRNFDAMQVADKLDMAQRYLDFQAEAEALAKMEAVTFEWVYPDEDGDSCPVQVNLDTGEVTPTSPVPADIKNRSVRTRLNCEDWAEPISVYYQQRDEGGAWMLKKQDLLDLKALLT